jgi:branched-chain amino acid aminotransferase
MEIARTRGFEIQERHIRPEELATFSECFIVGTAAEVTPVAQVGEYRFTPGNISLSLMDDYAGLVRRQRQAA